MAQIEIRRAAERLVTRTGWLHSAHSFSFGPHYDPSNLSFGRLLACNVDEVQPGEGYPRHRHSATEILTWVLDGTLEHVDVTGNRTVSAGGLQYLSTGSGIEHAERSAAQQRPVRVVQLWLAGRSDGRPRYESADLTGPLAGGGLVLAASGSRPAPITLDQPGAELLIGRLLAGASVQVPACRWVHVLLAAGRVRLADGAELGPQDALRITDGGARLRVLADAELLVLTMG